MEKRHKKTLARTLNCATVCTKITLIAALFIPGLVTVTLFTQKAKTPAFPQIAEHAVKVPKELVKIYSIVKSQRPDISEEEGWKVAEVILEQSSKHSFDPLLVLAMIQVESGFQYAAVSPAGARGIMQLLPDVAKDLLSKISPIQEAKPKPFKPEYLDDPVLNIQLGVTYLHDLRNNFRNLNLALIAYNLGPTEIRNRLDNKMELSDDYSTAVLAAYHNYKNAKMPLF
ncbi:MAG TPA: lytic transglycosylase domain-containing protein [Candidatus Acidoferrales bacterium]|nr:lytic transglycosylase domain-containing protein [Candidatus Acidoferrales bacterium]